MGTAVIGGIIAAAGAITAGAINAASQKSANDANREINEEAMKYQTSERLAAQEYNTPENQRKRFEAAGINPYLAMSDITAGNAEAQSAPAMQGVSPIDYSGIFEGINAGMDTYSKFQQTESMQLGIERDRVDTTYKISEKLLEIEKMRTEIANSKVDIKTKNKQLENLDIYQKQLMNDLEFSTSTLDDRKAAIKKQNNLMDLDAKAKDLQNEYQQVINDMQPIQRKILERTISEINSRIDFNKSSSANQAANAAVAVMEEQLKKAEKEGVKLDNFHKSRLNPIIRNTAKEEFRAKKYDADHPNYFDQLMGNFDSAKQRENNTMGTMQPKPGSALLPQWQP